MNLFDRMDAAVREAHMDLRHHVRSTGPADFAEMPLKATPKLHVPHLQLADFTVAQQVTLPVAVHRSSLGSPLLADSLGNTDWGNCGDSMVCHGIECFHLDAGTEPPPFATDDSLNLYSEVSGFNINAGPPGQNPTDTGTDNDQLVKYWQSKGVLCKADGSVHKIVASLGVEPTDYMNKMAIWEFVVLFRSLALPLTAQTQGYWKLVGDGRTGDSAPGSWGYHDIPVLSYDQTRYRVDSWGIEMLMDIAFDNAYARGGFVVVTEEQLNLRGVSPAGVDWTALNATLRTLTSAPIE